MTKTERQQYIEAFDPPFVDGGFGPEPTIFKNRSGNPNEGEFDYEGAILARQEAYEND